MLPGDEVALFDGALFGVAALAFEIEFHALAPALPANRADISCQVALLTFLFRCGLQPWQAFFPLTQSSSASGTPVRRASCVSQTLRFFGGRQPLCGIGVTSLIERTSMPAVDSARTADSRPEPGPLTRTSTVRKPALGGLVGRRHGRLLGGERRSLARPAKPERAGAGPGDGVPFLVRDGHDGVVERGLDMHDARVDDALFLLLEALLLALSLRVLSP